MTNTRSKFLEKDNIVLRPVEIEDAEFLKELIQHPEVRDTIGRPPIPVNTKSEKESLKERTTDDNQAYFLIEHNGENVGTIFLHGLQSQYRKGEFGISIHPDFHGQGIGTDSLKLLVKYGFESQNLHKIRGGYLEGNDSSRRVMEKAGFQEEGRERHYKYVDAEWKDVTWMGILEEEYYNNE